MVRMEKEEVLPTTPTSGRKGLAQTEPQPCTHIHNHDVHTRHTGMQGKVQLPSQIRVSSLR